ncbi:MAG: hypothetical protein C5B50_16635 [Verrucomicrobia bacterium]|nr:MAG: hypothetical protein C5B50_16635 [Verrucomicrobiota bacterium]
MIPALALFLALGMVSLGLAGAACVMAWRLAPARERRAQIGWLARWGAKGLVLPCAAWWLLNLGISWWLQPFMPQIQAAQNSGFPWAPEFLSVAGAGLFIVSSYWTATTLAWVVFETGRELEEEAARNFKGLCWTCILGLCLPAIVVLALGGWYTVGLAAFILLAPIAGLAPRFLGRQVTPTPPIYARAIARIKFGKYNEAEMEIIKELEKSEEDFDGWMMLAELYANHFNDLQEAEQTVLGICEQPVTSPSQLSVALHRLADWQLKTGRDPEAARRALQMICDRLPGTHLAHMAQLRIAQLPASIEELSEREHAPPIPLPALGDHFDEAAEAADSAVAIQRATEAANACVDRLNQDPDNVAAREKLARLLAEKLGQPDRGIEQLTLLFQVPGQEARRRSEWLSWIAAWHLKYRGDRVAGRAALERIVREFPDTPQAIAARQRLGSM